MAPDKDAGLPQLLVQAARSAAEADGLPAPDLTAQAAPSSSADASAAAAALTSFSETSQKKEEANAEALQRARAAIAAAAAARPKPTPPPVSSSNNPAAATTASLPPQGKMPTPTLGNMAAPSGGSKKKGPPLRRGKWTPEEELYANRLIQEFKAGLLPLTDGTTLRTFLSKLLNCDPMRISKKFVGSNCIGKQVFRRRTADINRLTAEQIQQSRNELSELERRFLERVAQTNRVKSSGSNGGNGAAAAAAAAAGVQGASLKDELEANPPNPPWLQPPVGYKHGSGAAMAAAALRGCNANNRAAAAGRALLQGLGGKPSNPGLSNSGSAGLLAMAELQRRTSRQNLLQNALANRTSASNLMAAAGGGGSSGLSGSAIAQIARNASAARLAGLAASGNSMNNLMLKAGLSRDQLSQLAREQGLTSGNSLSNMMERQSSFDALMSLDFQSLQSIDNLANLIQTGGGVPGQSVPETGLKNWSAESGGSSSTNLGGLAEARRLASVGRMESLLRSLSSNNVNKQANMATTGGASNSNFNNIIQSMQSNLSNLGSNGASAGNLFGNGGNAASAASLANLLRADSSTGLTALRMQDGLNQRNTSVDDFLSLVASGDIPHQDPTLLNVPLMQQQPSQAQAAAAQYLAQQQLLAQASGGGNSALANALRSGSLGNLGNASAGNLNNAAALIAAQQQQQRQAQLERLTASLGTNNKNKRRLDDGSDGQGPAKR